MGLDAGASVTVDNLPGAKLPRKQLSTRPVPGRFGVSGEGDTLYLSPGNFSRYTPFVQLVESVDTEPLVSLYVEIYPLFQQAYEELGYPSAYFNDRLIDVMGREEADFMLSEGPQHILDGTVAD